MLSRLLSLAIVLFWITMTALLVRSEMWPEGSGLRGLPVEHLAKLLWRHQERSDLVISTEGLRRGNLTLHPKVRPEDQARILEYSGNLQMRLPGSGRQRLSWDGVAEFDRRMELRKLLLGLGLREPLTMRAEILILPAENLARYTLLNNGIEIETREFTLDEAGVRKIFAQLDLDPAIFEAVRGSSPNAPEITAQQSSLRIRTEHIDTYLLSVRQSGQTLLEAHISQLGKVLEMKTLIGYTLAPDDL